MISVIRVFSKIKSYKTWECTHWEKNIFIDNDYNSEESVMLYENTKQQRDSANESDTFSVQNLY